MYNEEEKNYKYDAFISYRHSELDQFVAEKIQKYLEEFKLPKNVKGKSGLKKTKIQRVFRDKEELTITNNLEDPIVQALKGSEYLIVICSPRIKESVWCRKEIEKFIQYHGRNKILTVLIEGEPGESFPEELLYEEEMVKENGVETIYRKEIEPLAADIRAKSRRQMCTLLKTELLRVIAPIFGLEYDDLRQRHRERKVKRVLTATVAAAGLGLAVGVAGVASAMVINSQKDKITVQNEKLLQYQAENLSEKALEYLELDRRQDAINTALASLTEFEGTKMPYTAMGRLALTQALRVYDIGTNNKAQNQLLAQANIRNMQLSPSGKYVMALDKTKKMYVWDVTTGELVSLIDDIATDKTFSWYNGFAGDAAIYYINKDNKVIVRNFTNNEDKIVDEDAAFVTYIKGDATGKYLVVNNQNVITVYDAMSGETVYQVKIEKDKAVNSDILWCNDKILYIEEDSEEAADVTESSRCIKIVDVKSGKVVEHLADYKYIDEAQCLGEYIYILINNFDSREEEEYGAVYALEASSGKVVWQSKYKDRVIDTMQVIEKDGEEYVAFSSYDEVICLDGKTGSDYYRVTLLEGITDFAVNNAGYGQILDKKGQITAFNIFDRNTYGMEYYLECKVSQIDAFKICQDGFLVLPMSSNYIIKYGITDNQDKEAYVADEALLKAMDELWLDFKDCTEDAVKIGVPNPELVANILYVNDNVAMVAYLDMTLEIYDVANKKVISSITDIESVPVQCFGSDNEGNIYITGYTCGYCFDKDYNLIAEIDDLKYVNAKEGYMVIGVMEDNLWKVPIYSMEELIEKAEEIGK